jgi:hypothetical protein
MGEGLVELADRVPLRKRYRVRKHLFKYPPYLVFMAAVVHADLRRHTVSLLRLRPSSILRSFSPRPHGRLESHRAGRLRANALSWRCFPAVLRHHQHPRPTVDPSVPLSPGTISQTPPPPPFRESIWEYSIAKNHIGVAEREILVLGYGFFNFQNPPYMASHG